MRLHTLHLLLVLGLKVARLLNHSLNVILAQTALVIRDRDLVALTRRLLSRRHIEDTVCIHIKRYFNLRNTTRHRWNSVKLELAEVIRITRELALTLKHLNQNTRLVVRIRAKRLRLLRRNGRVTVNNLRHYTTRRLQAQRQRNYINK